MPYLTNIGPRNENECGFGSRGYHIYRRGNTVICKWGQVEVIPGRKIKTVWKYIKSNEIRHRSKEKAIGTLKKQLRGLTKKGYRQLPTGIKIFPKRKK